MSEVPLHEAQTRLKLIMVQEPHCMRGETAFAHAELSPRLESSEKRRGWNRSMGTWYPNIEDQTHLQFKRVAQFGTVLDLRTTPSQKCEAVPRRARIAGS